MSIYDDDAELLKRQRHFLDDVERSIREANREILHERIPQRSQQSFVDMAHQVARLRAGYLQAALTASPESDLSGWVATLRAHRESYEEACVAFEALQRAIQRGYVDIGVPADEGTAAA